MWSADALKTLHGSSSAGGVVIEFEHFMDFFVVLARMNFQFPLEEMFEVFWANPRGLSNVSKSLCCTFPVQSCDFKHQQLRNIPGLQLQQTYLSLLFCFVFFVHVISIRSCMFSLPDVRLNCQLVTLCVHLHSNVPSTLSDYCEGAGFDTDAQPCEYAGLVGLMSGVQQSKKL